MRAESTQGTQTPGRTASGHTSAIRAGKVIGTNVCNRAGEDIGEIKDVVLDKLSNNIMFAIVGFGGFLGIAEKYHAVPWASLDYDESRNAYVIDASKEQLKSAPSDSMDALLRDGGLYYRDRSFDYYRAPRYW